MARVAISSWRDLIEETREADLPAVARDLGFRLRREGRSFRAVGHGGLILWQSADGWRWTWFSQGRSGDAISFVQEFGDTSFQEAVEVLSGERWPERSSSTRQNHTYESQRKKEEPKPDWGKWRERAEAFAEWAHENLIGPQGEEVRRWLQEERGIAEETAMFFKFGFCSRQFWRKKSDWGLYSSGEKDRLWLPPGLVIPYRNLNGELVGLQFRLFKPDEAQKYGLPTIKGSKIRFYFVSPSRRPIFLFGKPGRPLIVLESELDAILLWQLARDCDLSFAGLGSAGRKPSLDEDLEFFTYFLTAPAVILALDTDEAGRRATEWWVHKYRHVLDWPVPQGKDPTEFLKIVGETKVLRWLHQGLEKAADLPISQEERERVLESTFLLLVEFLAKEENKKAARLDGP